MMIECGSSAVVYIHSFRPGLQNDYLAHLCTELISQMEVGYLWQFGAVGSAT